MHVAAAQEIRVQRMSDPPVDGVLRSRQSLTNHLSAEYLWAANVATITAKNIVLDALKVEETCQVLKYRMHVLFADIAAVHHNTRAAYKRGVVTGEKQRDFRNIDRLAQALRRRHFHTVVAQT